MGGRGDGKEINDGSKISSSLISGRQPKKKNRKLDKGEIKESVFLQKLGETKENQKPLAEKEHSVMANSEWQLSGWVLNGGGGEGTPKGVTGGNPRTRVRKCFRWGGTLRRKRADRGQLSGTK